MHLHAALITALATVLFLLTGILVGRARGKFGVPAPATSGPPGFERVFRAQMNTLEQLALFLPVLWLATIYDNPRLAAWIGYAWLLGRLWYLFGYVREGGNRGPGFLIGMLAYSFLLVMALRGILRALQVA